MQIGKSHWYLLKSLAIIKTICIAFIYYLNCLYSIMFILLYMLCRYMLPKPFTRIYN